MLKFYFTVSPVCKLNEETVYEVAINEMVKITCQLEADPKDVKYKWLLVNSFGTFEIKPDMSNYTRSIAHYVPKHTSSYGKLLCFGENLIGFQKEPCVFHIRAAGTSHRQHLIK